MPDQVALAALGEAKQIEIILFVDHVYDNKYASFIDIYFYEFS